MDLHYNSHLTEFFMSDKNLSNAICHGVFTDQNGDTYAFWHAGMVWFLSLNGMVFVTSMSKDLVWNEYTKLENAYLKAIDL